MKLSYIALSLSALFAASPALAADATPITIWVDATR